MVYNGDRLFWRLCLIPGLLAAGASAAGVLQPRIYHRFLDPAMGPGVLSQDLISLGLSLLLLLVAFGGANRPVLRWGLAMGILGYLFYAYGLYVIERLYTGWYLVYMGIMGTTLYTIGLGLMRIGRLVPGQVQLNRPFRWLAAGVCLFSPLLFYPLWTGQLLSIMALGEKPEFYYGVYILDMVFVLPAYVIGAVLVLQNRREGLILVPALCVKGFTLLFSVGLSVLISMVTGEPASPGEAILYLLLAAGFLLLMVVHLRHLQVASGRPDVHSSGA